MVVAIIVVVVLTRGSGGNQAATTGTSGPTAQTTSTAAPRAKPIVLELPDGWVQSDDGLVAARDARDLTAEAPDGPRVRVELDDDSHPVDEEFEAARDAPPIEIPAEPDTTSLRGKDAVALTTAETVDGTELVRRYITVDTPDHALLIIFEAPTDEWDDAIPILQRIPTFP